MKYLFILEDDSMIQAATIPEEIMRAWQDRTVAIVDMECGMELLGDGDWEVIDIWKGE